MTQKKNTWDYRNPYEWMARVTQNSFPPVIINCAITGGIHGKEANQNLPETAEEQADAVYEAYKAGAAVVHIHARDPQNSAFTTAKAEDYSRVNRLIRERCPDIIINSSTGGGPHLTAEERLACLDADPAPDMASLNPGPFMAKGGLKERKAPLSFPHGEIPLDLCVPNTYGGINQAAKIMMEKGIKPEIELFHPGQYWVIHDMIMEGNLETPYIIQFVMGFQTSIYPTPANVLSLVNELPENSMFIIPGLGPYQIPMNALAIILGGHVRVGLEDNVYYKKGEKAKSNAQFVKRVKRMAEDMNREVATVVQARKMMGLPDK